MMIMLRDDQVIEIFRSADAPPSWIEAIDIENGEYRFCDERGQWYTGEITRPSGWFKAAEFRLRPEGSLSLDNALELIKGAQGIEPNDEFPDLESLRRYLTKRSEEPPPTL
jgi:hypothetical protein